MKHVKHGIQTKLKIDKKNKLTERLKLVIGNTMKLVQVMKENAKIKIPMLN